LFTYVCGFVCSQDDPTMQEKVDMAQSIVNSFPVLKDPITGGYVSIINYLINLYCL